MSQENKNAKPPYGIIAILMVGAFIAFLNNTLLNIALPSIMKDLNVETSTVQWLSTGFMLVNGILIPTTAFLIRKYSVRNLFLTAILLFTAGTILGGTAEVFPVLLAGRMLQASGSAILMPLLMNVMLVSFPIEKRGTAMGIFGLILMAAPAIGPTLSGWIIEKYNWRMLFHFITPIAVVTLILGFFWLKDKKEKIDIKLDYLSLLLSSIGFGGLLYGFSSAGSKGWDSIHVYLPLIVGTISLIIFVLRSINQENPMLNFSVFKYPMFALSATIAMVVNMSMFSGMLLLPIYIQTLRGISPLDAGLMLLPGALIMAVMSPITGKLFDKIGGRILAITGLSITVFTTYLFSQLGFDDSYGYLIAIYSIRMFGMSMVMMPVSTNGLNQLPAVYYPHGTAMNNTLSQISGAIGTAVLVTVMSSKAASIGEKLGQEAYASLVASGNTITEEVLAAMEVQVKAQATLEGINFAFVISTFIALVALILAFFIKRSTPQEVK